MRFPEEFSLHPLKQQSHPPLQRGKPWISPLQGRGACALPAQRARKSLHSPLSKGRELHAPGLSPFLVSPSSTCIIYFKSHFRHKLSTLDIAKSYVPILTSLDQRTQLTNKRFCSASCRPRSASCRPRFYFFFSSLIISVRMRVSKKGVQMHSYSHQMKSMQKFRNDLDI
ncbi:hypothetical protein T07_11381 [Trichinella nelsoni]|uniref:Uncharacterized protein n=1 Tax=Trichinella nelsoni TaxID=6336 RepID=A0A0V0RRZ7_9BILA|nr:hypothetical protein T07_11381 [Trichinella nelsoni]